MEFLLMSFFCVMSSVVSGSFVGVGSGIMACYCILLSWGLGFVFKAMLSEVLTSEWIMEDSLSSLMLVLTILVMVISFLCSDKDFELNRCVGGFSFVLGLVGFICVAVFMVSSFFLFYFFFESSLVPTLFLILGWGYQPERLQAGFYMMMYTVSASMPLFIGLCWISSLMGSDNMLEVKQGFGESFGSLVWFFLILGFLVKLPVFLVHGWLPKAHVEAPVSGSMVLAGILLKLGGYGLFRFFTVLGFYAELMGQIILISSLWGGVLCSMMCLAQSDMKALIAYSSVGHMSLVLGGLLSFFCLGWMSGVCLMFAHGLCSPCLFSLANSTYSCYSSRSLMMCKGVLKFFPSLTLLWFLMSVLNMACPPSINFLSECFLVGSLLFLCWDYVMVVSLMCFVTAGYCLFLYCSVNHGGSLSPSLPKSVVSDRVIFPVLICGGLLFFVVVVLDYSFV